MQRAAGPETMIVKVQPEGLIEVLLERDGGGFGLLDPTLARIPGVER